MERILLGSVDDVPKGRSRTFIQHGKKILVANVDGNFFAYENFCPHMGGALRSESERTFKCGWHGAVFNAESGDSISGISEGARLKKMNVAVADGKIWWEKEADYNPWDDFS
jgi:nitrite reductase/ring-hydroxylating ferredoxin subunit